MSATMPRRVPGFRVALVALLSISLLVLIGCQKKEIEELLGSELFSLSLGKLENQIDLFPSSGGTMEKKTDRPGERARPFSSDAILSAR